ncbi:MAG: fasciclin domain-containing protein [Ardenticatenaceae bacterium]|nr:fasciclin domain-containing protein [Ardenticatenaceae bacterium]
MKKLIVLFVLVLSMVLTTAVSAAEMPTIYDIAASNADFDSLTAAVDAAGLKSTLEGAGPFTVFAPTDDAFAALSAAGIDVEATLANVLLYHVVPGKLMASDVLSQGTLNTAFAGKSFNVAVEGGNAVITTPDGAKATIVATDIEASNGVIHVIDAVIPPPVNALALSQLGDPTKSIAEVAIANGNFNTLVAALSAAGLADTFASPGNYTVFAPTDAAFAKLPAGTIDALLADPSGQLTDILKYHVINDALSINQVANSDKLLTLLSKNSIDVSFGGGMVMADGCHVVLSNIRASNGVIHVIDCVLLP